MNIGLGQTQVAKERPGHRRVVMLAGVHEKRLKLGAAPFHRRHDGRDFHEVWSRAGYIYDFQHWTWSDSLIDFLSILRRETYVEARDRRRQIKRRGRRGFRKGTQGFSPRPLRVPLRSLRL